LVRTLERRNEIESQFNLPLTRGEGLSVILLYDHAQQRPKGANKKVDNAKGVSGLSNRGGDNVQKGLLTFLNAEKRGGGMQLPRPRQKTELYNWREGSRGRGSKVVGGTGRQVKTKMDPLEKQGVDAHRPVGKR